ncbi:Hypothetical predicted protein [Mytilus galloprovincialis]|uniref:Uncharacterized protein n=1 Tax=Mytilus galloprovincialis TaxID=29158 RepID=A0A8B6HDJ3_MYTGA|nr:Hypothetical predicted protein [Mytilus galloprovincialis]
MDRMYVPNPQKWVKYYENMAKGNHNPYINQSGDGKRKQVGGSLIGSQGTFMIPIENVDHLENQNSSNPLTVQLVSPAQQTVEQAKTELQVLKKGIKRKASPQPLSLTKKRRTEVRSNSQLTGNIIDMEITGKHGMEYVDLKRSKLYVKAKLVKGDGSNLTENEYVGPINLFLQSMFSQVQVTMQGKLVSSTTNHYPYKAMIQTLLSHGSESKTSQLTSQFWIKDVAGHLDDNDVNSGSNRSLNTRSRYFAQSKTGDMEGPLCHDLFHMDRYILNQVAINVRLTRTRPEFCLMTNEVAPDFKVIIEDIVLKACKIQINPAVIYGHAEILKSVNAKYPFTKTEVKQITVAAGTVNFAQDQLFQNIRPNRVVVGFVNALAAAGDYTKNPFNFQHFNLNQIGVFVDNIPVSGNLMRLNFDAVVVPLFQPSIACLK